MWTTIKQFYLDNQSSILVSIIVGTIFFILGPLGLWFSGKKVKREKINKAVSELLDLFESMLVNKESMSISKLLTLFRAIERQNSVNLGIDSDLNNILEDLSLRFAKSKHLPSEQKDFYQKAIESLIGDLNAPKTSRQDSKTSEQRELPKSLKSIITDLRQDVKEMNPQKLEQSIDLLEKQYPRYRDPLFNIIRVVRERPKYFIVFLVIYLIIVAFVLYFMPLT